MDPERRMRMYRQAERILVEDAGGVFLVYPLSMELRKPWLKGLKVNRYGYSFFTWDNMVHTYMYIARHYSLSDNDLEKQNRKARKEGAKGAKKFQFFI